MSERGDAVVVFMCVLPALICLGGAVAIFSSARSERALLSDVAAAASTSAAGIRGADDGQRVVAAGRIDPAADVDSTGGFIARQQEHLDTPTCHYESGMCVGGGWYSTSIVTTPFSLLMADGQVGVTNGCRIDDPVSDHRQDDLCYALRVERSPQHILQESRDSRAIVFRPGEEVVVVGEAQGGAIVANEVFGGGPDRFVAVLERNIFWSWAASGVLLLLAIATPMVLFALYESAETRSVQ